MVTLTLSAEHSDVRSVREKVFELDLENRKVCHHWAVTSIILKDLRLLGLSAIVIALFCDVGDNHTAKAKQKLSVMNEKTNQNLWNMISSVYYPPFSPK